MSRASVSDWERVRAGLIQAYNRAMMAMMACDEGPEAERAEELADSYAAAHGWEPTQDGDYMDWALKATGPERIAEKLRMSLDGRCKPQTCDHCGQALPKGFVASQGRGC